jgi:polysaccharide deacetylase 2 family uncharacterized protein YibQ
MNKTVKIILFIGIILVPIIFYRAFIKREVPPFGIGEKITIEKPKIAIIFDDLGENVSDLEEIRSLNIPVTVAIIPGLRFSKSAAYTAYRYDFSILIHLPLAPKNEKSYRTYKYTFLSSSLPKQKLEYLLRRYLNDIRFAIGVSNHMGSGATEDEKLMRFILSEIKKKDLLFIDSRTSTKSVAYAVAQKEGLLSGYNEGFLDVFSDFAWMKGRLNYLITQARKKGKIITIAHPKKSTFNFLKKILPTFTEEVDFITIKDFFGL